MGQETGFSVDGRIYPVPAIDTFTFDELETLHRYCGLTINDWGRRFTPDGAEVWEKGTDSPGFQQALVHIAYRRGNRDLPDETVRDLVRDLVWLDVIEPLLSMDEEPDPLAGTSESGSSQSDSEPSTKPGTPSSGTSSQTGSEKDANPDAPTGTTESDTSSTPLPLRQVI